MFVLLTPPVLQALPAFRSLLLASSPVALSLQNCADEPLVLQAVQAKVMSQLAVTGVSQNASSSSFKRFSQH